MLISGTQILSNSIFYIYKKIIDQKTNSSYFRNILEILKLLDSNTAEKLWNKMRLNFDAKVKIREVNFKH